MNHRRLSLGTTSSLFLLMSLTFVLTVVQSNFVGDLTIYSPDLIEKREEIHTRIVNEQPPGGGLDTVGTSMRIAVPYVIELVHRATGMAVGQLYKHLDMVCIWVTLTLFFIYLRRWFDISYCLVAVMYVAAVMPLTYAFHYFHPWDRPGLLLWLVAIWQARERRPIAFAIVLAAAVIVKYDAIILPVLYVMANASRANWRRSLLEAFCLGTLAAGIYLALLARFPEGMGERPVGLLVASNLSALSGHPLTNAPVLAFAIPLGLAIYGYELADRFGRSCLWFVAILCVALFLLTYFVEVRAEQMLFLLLAPCALIGLERVIGRP